MNGKVISIFTILVVFCTIVQSLPMQKPVLETTKTTDCTNGPIASASELQNIENLKVSLF